MFKSKKSLIIAAIVFCAVGILAVSGNVKAEQINNGDLVKIDGVPTIYYINNGKRDIIPYIPGYEDYQNAVMDSWSWESSNIKTVSVSELQSYSLGDNIKMKPNYKYLLRKQNEEEYFIVSSDATLVGVNKAGFSNYATVIIPDAYFIGYQETYPTVTIISPNGGEEWEIGSTQTIKWTSLPGIKSVWLGLTNNEGAVMASNLVNVTGNPGETVYSIASNIPAGSYRIRIDGCPVETDCDYNKRVAYDLSDQSFNIKPVSITQSNPVISNLQTDSSSITVISPNGGEKWEVGKTYSIRWKPGGLEKVNINLLSADPIDEGAYRVTRIVSDINALLENYLWNVPEKMECLSLPCLTLSEYRNHVVEIVDARYGRNSTVSQKFSDDSDAPFIIIKNKIDTQISDINNKSKLLHENKLDLILVELNQLRNTIKEQQNEIKYLKSLIKGVKGISESAQNTLNNFITYGVDENTKKLGERERAGVMDSYKSAFNKLPETEEELTDAIKIANGRFPSITNDQAEKKAKEQFIKIYKRIPDMSSAKDDAAVKVMAYGLRPAKRNLGSEKAGLSSFKSIYGHLPQSAAEWDAMRAITYSGTKRMPDADKDLLPDEMEQKLGTNPAKADTDGDGFKDGSEVNDNTDPLKK